MFTLELIDRQDDLSGNQPPWRAVIAQRPIGLAMDLRGYENGSNQSVPPQTVIEPLLVIELSRRFDEVRHAGVRSVDVTESSKGVELTHFSRSHIGFTGLGERFNSWIEVPMTLVF